MAIESLRAQTLPAWEALIVDDGSTEAELEEIRQMVSGEPRIRLVVRDCPPAGANHCRNIGIQLAHSDLLVFLDSDDMLSPACLEARVATMQAHPDLAFVAFLHEHFLEQPGDMNAPSQVREGEDHLDRLLIMNPPWQTAGPTWRRSAVDAVGPWDESLPSGQDWDYHVRALSLRMPYEILPGPRFFHRMTGSHRESISSAKLSPSRVEARERMFVKGYQLLLEKGLLTDKRRLIFARSFLVVSEMWAALGDRTSAARCWGHTLDFGLVSHRRYREGLLLLRVFQSALLRRAMRVYGLIFWPKHLHVNLRARLRGAR
jgi:glycosyltransferase involved in cell wall biosynthesis